MAPVLEVQRPWNLAETGWAVVFAHDIDRRVKSALGELLEHRRQSASYAHGHYYRELTYTGEKAFDFVKMHGGKPGMFADPDLFPYYVLLVGSPESLPYQFQAELDVNHAVGRVYFNDYQSYADYARSLVHAEEMLRPRSQEIVFFATEHEGDPASQSTVRDLVRPLAEGVLDEGMNWRVREVCGVEARKERLRALLGGTETPAFLFAACHGLGLDEWDERQEDCQGALVCQDWPGPYDEEGIWEDQWFAATDIIETASLHDLIAFFYASYSVGTPARDNFDQTTFGRTIPIAPRPLLARLPQRLLSHRAGGALAVIGHIGHAWVPSFSGSLQGEGNGAFLYGLRRLLQGHTVGWAMEHFNQSYASLTSILGNLDEDPRFSEIDDELIANLWLLRNDARNLMVFGDPAVRLPGVGEPR
jgi:hypothetical protein